ncbi:MAG: outer membrane lipoprotein carrier protein LolA [Planctomycetota bacterium]
MKPNYIILVLAVVIAAAIVGGVVLSLKKSDDQAKEDEVPAGVDEGNGKEKPGENGNDKPVKPDNENGGTTPANGENGEPSLPDNGNGTGEPPKITPEDELLNEIYYTQRRLVSLAADLTLTQYGIMNDAAGTDREKRIAGNTSRGKLKHKPGNKFAFTLKSEDEEQFYYGYMHTIWIVIKTENSKTANRWLISEERRSEAIASILTADRDQLKQTFEIKLLDPTDASERKTLLRLGYEDKDLPPKAKETRKILKLIYRDPSRRRQYSRIDVVVGYKKVETSEERTEEVPVIEMVKLYDEPTQASTPAAPKFKGETLVWLDNIKLDFGAGEYIPDSEFRFNPAKEGVEEPVDHTRDALSGTAEILARMKRTRSFTRGLTAHFKSDTYHAALDKHEIWEGPVRFMRPESFRFETTGPKTKILASDGITGFVHKPAEKKAVIFDVAKRKQEGKGLPFNLELYKHLLGQTMDELAQQYDFELKTGIEKIGDTETLHFELKRKILQTPGESEPTIYSADRMELWVELETFLAARLRIYDRDLKQDYEEITLTDMQTDRKIEKSFFKVPEFPEGTEIEER